MFFLDIVICLSHIQFDRQPGVGMNVRAPNGANDLVLTPLPLLCKRAPPDAGGSSNGRTADSDSVNQGSNPCPSATESQRLTACAVSLFSLSRRTFSRVTMQVPVLSPPAVWPGITASASSGVTSNMVAGLRTKAGDIDLQPFVPIFYGQIEPRILEKGGCHVTS